MYSFHKSKLPMQVQAPSYLFTIFCSIADLDINYVKSLFTEELLPGKLGGLGYTYMTLNMAQQIGSTPAGCSYAKPSDIILSTHLWTSPPTPQLMKYKEHQNSNNQ